MKIEDIRRTGFMDLTDLYYELGDSDETSIYAREEQIRDRNCVEECGIVEVEVRVIRVVKQPSESSLNNME